MFVIKGSPCEYTSRKINTIAYGFTILSGCHAIDDDTRKRAAVYVYAIIIRFFSCISAYHGNINLPLIEANFIPLYCNSTLFYTYIII